MFRQPSELLSWVLPLSASPLAAPAFASVRGAAFKLLQLLRVIATPPFVLLEVPSLAAFRLAEYFSGRGASSLRFLREGVYRFFLVVWRVGSSLPAGYFSDGLLSYGVSYRRVERFRVRRLTV